MTAPANPAGAPSLDDVRAFYDAYYEALDENRLKEWPDFFVEDCLYRIIPRENYEAGQGTCIMQGDSKGMLIDRIQAILSTQVYAPRYCRRFYSGLRLVNRTDRALEIRQNLLVVHTLVSQPSKILGCGDSRDRLILTDSGQLKLVERTIVLDTEMIDNTIIYPF
jgi:3-phenylpropionate/cinnamic acid dioxygenase small subunit